MSFEINKLIFRFVSHPLMPAVYISWRW